VREKYGLDSLKGRDHLEDLDIYGRIILKLKFVREVSWKVWIRFIWLRMWRSGGLF
jgi:hypothetical protein